MSARSASANTVRRLLRDTVEERITAALAERGFARFSTGKDAPTHLHFRREHPAGSGAYDLFTVTFDRRQQPSFHGVLNRVGPEPIRQPWGETVAVDAAHALTPSRRVLLQQRSRGLRAKLLPGWFAHAPFSVDESADKDAVNSVVTEFLACLPQADHWWAGQTSGPNLVNATVGETS